MGCGASAPVADGEAGAPAPPKVDPDPVDPEEENWAWNKTVLERFTVKGVDVLGVGSFSVVRKGVDLSTGRAVAVKALKARDNVKFRREVFLFDALFMPEEADSKGVRAIERSPTVLLGQQEYRKCKNPFASSNPQDLFVQLLAHSELGSENDDAWSILELGNFTLHDLILACNDAERQKKRHCLQNSEQLARALLHVTSALAFLHSRLFIHGDMKPANIMWFEPSKRWKLIDMDGLRLPSEVADMKHADFYTVIYAAPELARAVADEGPLRLSRCLDVWSAGLCVLEMKLLQPLLESKFQSCCDDAEDGDGLNRFFQWLGSTEEALEPVKQISESSEVLQLIAGRMLLRDPLERSSPAQLLQEPALQQSYEALPDVMLEEPAETNPAPKPKTTYQLFQEAHREEARAELQTSGLSLCLSCCLLPAASQISLLEASTSTCHRFF